MTASGLPGARLRRFYKTATVGEAAGGYAVLLDGKQLKTPAGAPLVLTQRRLVEALAVEWDSQTGEIRPDDMPLMRLVSTAIDRVAPAREGVIDEIVGYGGTDMVCYRVGHPTELAHRQQVLWQPLVDWATLRYDAPLTVTTGIMPQRQPEEALRALRAVVGRLEPLALTGLHGAAAASGSLVLGLALLEGKINAEVAWEAAQLEETWQLERWGADEEAVKRRAGLRAELESTTRFLDLLRT